MPILIAIRIHSFDFFVGKLVEKTYKLYCTLFFKKSQAPLSKSSQNFQKIVSLLIPGGFREELFVKKAGGRLRRQRIALWENSGTGRLKG
jgi:hypothetical protein